MLRDERNEKFKKFKYIKYWLTLWVCCAMSVHLRDNPSLKSALWNSVLFVQRKKRTKQINKTLKACTWGEESNVRGYKKTMGGSRAREICKRRKVHQNMQEKKKTQPMSRRQSVHFHITVVLTDPVGGRVNADKRVEGQHDTRLLD